MKIYLAMRPTGPFTEEWRGECPLCGWCGPVRLIPERAMDDLVRHVDNEHQDED